MCVNGSDCETNAQCVAFDDTHNVCECKSGFAIDGGSCSKSRYS